MSDGACKDKARKACTQGNKIGSVTASLNADKPSAATNVDRDAAAIANNENGTPLITGGTPKEIGGGFTGAADDGQGNFNSFIDTPIRAIALQIGCLVDVRGFQTLYLLIHKLMSWLSFRKSSAKAASSSSSTLAQETAPRIVLTARTSVASPVSA